MGAHTTQDEFTDAFAELERPDGGLRRAAGAAWADDGPNVGRRRVGQAPGDDGRGAGLATEWGHRARERLGVARQRRRVAPTIGRAVCGWAAAVRGGAGTPVIFNWGALDVLAELRLSPERFAGTLRLDIGGAEAGSVGGVAAAWRTAVAALSGPLSHAGDQRPRTAESAARAALAHVAAFGGLGGPQKRPRAPCPAACMHPLRALGNLGRHDSAAPLPPRAAVPWGPLPHCARACTTGR